MNRVDAVFFRNAIKLISAFSGNLVDIIKNLSGYPDEKISLKQAADIVSAAAKVITDAMEEGIEK